jgi:hypothetical protein
MSKKTHNNRSNCNNNTNEKPLFNILTESKIQKMMQEQLTFTHGLMKAKKPVSGILTVASIEETDDADSHGEAVLSCSTHLYYSIMMNAIETILSGMDQEGYLAQFGLNPLELASDVVENLILTINSALGIDCEEGVDDLNHLIEERPEMLDFIDNHFSSLIFVSDDSEED